VGALSGLCRLLNDAQVLSSGFAGPTICNQVKRDLLAFIEGAQACALHGGDGDENVITPPSGGIKSKPFWLLNHFTVPLLKSLILQNAMDLSCVQRSRLVEYWGEGR
jgi:hypothetical protein